MRGLRAFTWTPSGELRDSAGKVVYTAHSCCSTRQMLNSPLDTRPVAARPADHKLLSRAVADWLARRIIAGEEAPGARLTEPKLAALAGVSRSPVQQQEQRAAASFAPVVAKAVYGCRHRTTGGSQSWFPTQ